MRRVIHAKFFREGTGTKLAVEMLGTDSVFICDGRWNNTTSMMKAKEHARKLNKGLNKGIIAVELRSGTFSNYTTLRGIEYFD